MDDKGLMLRKHGIVFNAKPDAVPYNYRISYKVSQLCLIMSTCSRQGSCSLIKLHMISYALCSTKGMDKLAGFTESKITEAPIVRFDPSVNRALLFAIADGLIVQQKTGTYKLTVKGRALTVAIENDPTVMVVEKADLSLLEKKLTEEKIKQLSELWRGIYVKD